MGTCGSGSFLSSSSSAGCQACQTGSYCGSFCSQTVGNAFCSEQHHVLVQFVPGHLEWLLHHVFFFHYLFGLQLLKHNLLCFHGTHLHKCRPGNLRASYRIQPLLTELFRRNLQPNGEQFHSLRSVLLPIWSVLQEPEHQLVYRLQSRAVLRDLSSDELSNWHFLCCWRFRVLFVCGPSGIILRSAVRHPNSMHSGLLLRRRQRRPATLCVCTRSILWTCICRRVLCRMH